MLCSNCKMTRAENEAPCQNCGAPSSLLQISQDGSWGWGNSAAGAPGMGNNGNSWGNAGMAGGSWGGPGNSINNAWGTPTNGNGNDFGASWNNGNPGAGMDAGAPQLAFDAATTFPPELANNGGNWSNFSQSGQASRTPTGGLLSGQRTPTGSLLPGQRTPTGNLQPPSQSMLPAIYQGGNEMALPNGGRSNTMTLQLLPDQMAEHLLPAIPDQPAEEMTYVPPMYTNPRPIIPRYRAISGLLSVLIVSLLICGGVGYYAKTSGRLSGAWHFITGTNPLPTSQVKPTPKIPDPKSQPDYGPALNVIPSAALGSRIDPNSHMPVINENVFKPKTIFYLTFTIQKQDKDGTLTLQWYTNKHPLLTEKTTITPKQFTKDGKTGPLTGEREMSYELPSSGSVEISWNGKLAQRLYFAVR